MDETLAWIRLAKSCLGLKEIHGPQTNPLIQHWWKGIHSQFTDDETAWCAAFVGGILEDCGYVSSRSAAARSYENWGKKLPLPCVGCIVVFWRGSPDSPTGHVGFVVGKDKLGNLMVLAGNQGDEVSIKPFSLSRVVAYRWPTAAPGPYQLGMNYLPVLASDGPVSTNEG